MSSTDVPVQAGIEEQVTHLQRWEGLQDRADKGDRNISGKPFVRSSLLKGCRWETQICKCTNAEKSSIYCFEGAFPPTMCSSICLSVVCLSFLPSDNLTLISPALLSWSRSFLSQFR